MTHRTLPLAVLPLLVLSFAACTDDDAPANTPEDTGAGDPADTGLTGNADAMPEDGGVVVGGEEHKDGHEGAADHTDASP